ncbi:DUF92 domain-containing protein [Thermococcus gorgonarius]|uniref:TIGR00297 family protein n=1 Tax=Thermococcus gorgonarius TaxID=71997 RepID=A0A2Z2M5J5_THEGO|nr:DUF92 domain-containing protein [Thermococcus gorgonarius]ASJ01257.1 hypothetical protein A3K92_07075 [Thermococcus gorgonarius]
MNQGTLIVGMITIGILGGIAYTTRALDKSGVLASIILGILTLYLGGVLPFLALLVFLVAGVLATKYRFEEKVMRGFSSPKEKTRSLGNVLGNGLAVVIFLIIESITKQDTFWAATFSAIATVNGDTLASELGKIFGKRPILITNLKPVKPGTNGGVSLAGEAFALLGSLMIIPFALPLTSYKVPMAIAIALGGFIGVNLDSLIGATLENRGLTDNNSTNFIASLLGGLAGAVIFRLLIGG